MVFEPGPAQKALRNLHPGTTGKPGKPGKTGKTGKTGNNQAMIY
jgi:hypothetical protein